MLILFEDAHVFRLWEFKVSHGEMLIRSTGEEGNIDIKFTGVTRIDLPTTLNGVRLGIGGRRDSDWEPGDDCIFALGAGDQEFVVAAARVVVERNGLDYMDSSLTKWTEEAQDYPRTVLARFPGN